MQSSLRAVIRLDTGLQRRTTTNHTILVLGGTGKAETSGLGQPEARVRRSLPAASKLVVAGRPAATAPSTDARQLGSCRTRRRGLGGGDGHRPVRLHADPAADDRAGGLTRAAAGTLATANYVGYLAGAVAGDGLDPPGPLAGRLAHIPGRPRRHAWLRCRSRTTRLTGWRCGLSPASPAPWCS